MLAYAMMDRGASSQSGTSGTRHPGIPVTRCALPPDRLLGYDLGAASARMAWRRHLTILYG